MLVLAGGAVTGITLSVFTARSPFALLPPTTASEMPTHQIQGSVSLNDLTSRPVMVTFYDLNEAGQYTAEVNNNHYKVTLPGGKQSFEVEVTWNSLPEVYGTCYAGTVAYDSSEAGTSTTFDFRC